MELQQNLPLFGYKSILHGDVPLSMISFNNFIISYINIMDCLFKRFIDDLKQFNEGSILTALEQGNVEGKNGIDSVTLFVYQ